MQTPPIVESAMFLIPAPRRGHGRTFYVNGAFDRLLDDALAHAFGPRAPARAATRSPALDLSETDAAYTVTLDLPGVARDDVKVSVDGRQVTLEAQAKSTQEKKDGERTVYRERSEVSYSRSFTLPVEVDEAASQAKLDNGVLTLTLAKKVAPGASRITVN
jgi:HSP20 family protein